VNIYSHLFGTVLFFSLLIVICLRYHYLTLDTNDLIIFAPFFCGVILCFFLSTSFHTTANHSEAVAILGNQLDYLGIVLLMWGAIASSVYYCFYCDAQLQKVYWVVVSIVALACVIATFSPTFRSPALRSYRAAMYTALGLSAILFITHGLILYGWDIQSHRMSLTCVIETAALNLVGAVAYATRIPERLCSERFDVLGQSHQILHFMVILAGLTHMLGLLRAADFVHSGAHQCSR
jgi:adiponectin receptor